MKDKQWKEYWEVDLGVSYIPIDKLDPQVDMAALEEVTTVMCNMTMTIEQNLQMYMQTKWKRKNVATK